jgi:ATP-dependent Clp protease ATP-binding subunit ClpB
LRASATPSLTPDHLTDRAARPGAAAHSSSQRFRIRRRGRAAGASRGAACAAAVRVGRRRASRRPARPSAACWTRRSTRRSGLGDEFVSVEHLLLALDLVPRDALLAALQQVRGGQRVTSHDPEGSYQALEKYGRDLTALAEQGKLDPVIGRDEEIRRTIQVLSRRTKNNPC